MLPIWAERIAELVGTDHGRLAKVARDAGMDSPQLDRLRKGENDNPTVAVLTRIADALGVPLAALFTRPEKDARHGMGGERNPILDRRFAELLGALDVEVPAPDSWRGDILKALAALNRALRREDTAGESEQRATKTRR